MNAASLINQTSGKVEYYTPAAIICAARATMGSIDLDPFSSAAANERVNAKRIFTVEDDGFAQLWQCGHLWMNHPFGRRYNSSAIAKLVESYLRGDVGEACNITFACTSEAWFQPLLRRPQCFLVPRTNYLLPDGSVLRGVTKGSVVTYFGSNVAGFARNFHPLGVVKLPA